MEEADNSEMEIQYNAASVAVMSATIVVIGVIHESYIMMKKEPRVNRDIGRDEYIHSLTIQKDSSCVSQLCMSRFSFHNLCSILTKKNLLKPTIHLSVEQQVSMFLHTIGHDVRNSTISSRFFRSGETVSRYFNGVLKAVLALKDEFIMQPTNESPTPEKIATSDRYSPWFKDCIGAIDGTHIKASIPVKLQGRFRGPKADTTQNVLATVDYDLKVTFILVGWEGSAHDATILENALTRKNGLKIPNGKYYLADGGYGLRKGFIPPYRGVRYHLKEYSDHEPENYKELFNHRHSSLRTTIERAFGVLTKRFRVLEATKYWSYDKQIHIVIACCVLHNYIMTVDPYDEVLRAYIANEENIDPPRERTQREEREEISECAKLRDEIALAMYENYVM